MDSGIYLCLKGEQPLFPLPPPLPLLLSFFRFCFSRSGKDLFRSVSGGLKKGKEEEEGSSERLLNVNCFRLSLMELVSWLL